MQEVPGAITKPRIRVPLRTVLNTPSSKAATITALSLEYVKAFLAHYADPFRGDLADASLREAAKEHGAEASRVVHAQIQARRMKAAEGLQGCAADMATRAVSI